MSAVRKRAWCSLGCGLLWAFALSGCGISHPSSRPPSGSVANTRNAAVDAGLVQSLQRQIKEQNKRIAELRSQLDALKVIEQDTEEWKKSNRQPATLTPAATDRGH